jgi:hypothetical protein
MRQELALLTALIAKLRDRLVTLEREAARRVPAPGNELMKLH